MQIVYNPRYDGGEYCVLSKEESSHVVKVMRMREGEEVFLTKGNGEIYRCQIVQSDSNHCTVKIIEPYDNKDKRDFIIHLAVAPTKNINRMEWLIEKATEIGVDKITPLLCEHSERKTINFERWDKILVSAMKQSLKSYKPILSELTPFKDLVQSATEDHKLLAYCNGEDRHYIKDICQTKRSYLILIGPEGDFAPQETKLAKDNGFEFITLGSQRLRTETAALYSLANIHYLHQ